MYSPASVGPIAAITGSVIEGGPQPLEVHVHDANSCTPSPDDAAMCAPEWSLDLGQNMSTPVGTGTDIAVTLNDGTVAVVSPTGTLEWKGLTGSSSATLAAYAFNKLYVGAADGHVHEFSAAGCGSPTCTEIASSTRRPRSWRNPSLPATCCTQERRPAG